ncbi:MarR family winged helix-turn-helix transcriptional regulator [Pseudarthrobacter sp. Y6]|uniref:MarR family winged helix-turn-helix transcriptional regulator n=1 Tax=Pseudarthrobacter sp. Y6 TaxID=3418422 RepID=UPI003CEB12BF
MIDPAARRPLHQVARPAVRPALGGADDAAAADARAIVNAMRHLDIGNGRLRARLARELGLSVAELNALAFVRDSGDLTPKHLSLDLNITTGSVTSMIDRLERAGFLRRGPNPADRRSLLLQLTPAGTQAMDWVYDHFHRAVSATILGEAAPSVPGVAKFLECTAAALEDLSAPGAGQEQDGPISG